MLAFAVALLAADAPVAFGADGSCAAAAPVVVVGSLNVDFTIRVDRPPHLDETVLATDPAVTTTMGGKGANQAVAAARLAAGTRAVKFVGVFGNDAHAVALEDELRANAVDVSHSGRAPHLPSGQGIVMLSPDGSASSVVVSGANTAWPTDPDALVNLMVRVVRGARIVMLQREIPERVNLATAAASSAAGAIVLLDAGGVDAPIPASLIAAVDYLCPNESELARLTWMPVDTVEDATVAARNLLDAGARRVLVTLGARGAALVTRDDVVMYPAVDVPGGAVVDATAAGDAFRAAFAISLAESDGEPTTRGGAFAATAGALACATAGATPSLPTREAVCALLPSEIRAEVSVSAGKMCDANAEAAAPREPDGECPLRFGSRLNSMKSRPELWRNGANGGGLGALEMVARLGTAEGIDLVDFHYPQHLDGLAVEDVVAALAHANLAAGAVAVRFPADTFLRGGAFTNPIASIRAAAIDLVAEACAWAERLNAAGGVVVWPQFDGYNYHFQVNHTETWTRTVDALREAVDRVECANARVSYEFKPTDASTRFAVVPSTGAALGLVREVNRPGRFGLTLDLGHLLAAGENPAQSAAAVADAGALFGFHIGDAHSKLGAEDGLAFGSVHFSGALELVYWIRSVGYDGYVYFDTFPEAEDPVREAGYNVRAFKRMWRQAARLDGEGMGALLASHDAMGSLEMRESLVSG